MTNESAIKNAVARIQEGEDTEAVVRFIYHLGETEGLLKMAESAEQQLTDALLAAA